MLVRRSAVEVVTGVPAYISSLSPWEVKRLTSVSNGKATPESALPAEWQTQQSWDNANLMDSWGGGAVDRVRGRLISHGGGHGDHGYQGLIAFDYDGITLPTGFSVLSGSGSALAVVPPNGSQNIDAYSDGKPTSVHLYGNCGYDAVNDRFYRFGGSLHPSGSPTGYAWHFGTQWGGQTAFDTGSSSSNLSGANLHDGTLNRAIYVGQDGRCVVWDLNTFTLRGSPQTPFEGFGQPLGCGAFDAARHQGLIVTITGHFKVVHNPTTDALTITSQTLSGIPTETPQSICFAPWKDRYYVYAPTTSASSGSQPSTLYEVHPTTFAVTSRTLTGDIPTGEFNRTGSPGTDDNHGHYNRFAALKDEWNCLGMVLRMDDNAYVIGLN